MRVINKFLFIVSALLLISCSGGVKEGKNLLDKASFSIVGGDNQFAPTNITFPNPLSVQVIGPGDLSGIPIFFEIQSGSVDGNLLTTTSYTDANGIASAQIKSGINNGTISVKASIPGAQKIDKSVIFNVFISGNATSWRVTNAGGATENAGTPFTINVEALLPSTAVDTDITGARYISFSTDAPASPNATAVTLPADGFYNFTAGVIDTPPSVTLVNSSESGADTFTVTVNGMGITGSTSGIQVLDAAAADVEIIDGNTCAGNIVGNIFATAVNPLTLYVYYFDAYLNCISAATGNWTKSFTDPQVPFTAPIAGVNSTIVTPTAPGFTGTVSVDEGTYTDSTGTITTSDATPHHLGVDGLDTSSNYAIGSGVVSQVLIRAEDIANNLTILYDGSHNLTWQSNATATTPPTETGLASFPVTLPTNTSYTFAVGVLTTPTPNITFFNSAETPTITVFDDGVNCGASTMCGTSPVVTVSSDPVNKAVVRSAPLNAGGDANTFDATALTSSTDDSHALYCATYDQYGNYLGDDATSDWGRSGTITAGQITPSLTNQSTVTFTAATTGTGDIYCDVDGVNDGAGIFDSTGTFTILPGAPDSFQVDGGAGNGNAFAVTAGTLFSSTVRTYDADGNLCTNYDNATFSATVSYVGSTAIFPVAPAEIPLTYTSPKVDNSNLTSKSYNLNFSSGVATISNLLLTNDTENADEPVIRVVDNGATVTTGNSGAVTVNQSVLNSISLRTLANNAGTVINADSVTADNTVTMFAAGYDESGNYIGDQSVDWTFAAPTGNCNAGELAGNPIPLTGSVSAIFSPTTVGNCTITARETSLPYSDTTGALVITNGVVASFDIILQGPITNVTAGNTFNIIVTALDADGNTVVNYVPDTTYTITTTNPNSPEGQAPTGFTLLPGDFTAGVATVTGAAVYNAASDFTITATETGAGTTTGTSGTKTVDPNTLHHYGTQNATGPFVADGASTFTVDIEARDQWGNPTTTGIGALINLTAVRTSDEALVDAIANGTNLDLTGLSVKTFSGLTYRVSHGVQFVATDVGAVTTPAAERDTATFTPDVAGLVDYTLGNFSTTTPTAGVAFTARITARDVMGNTITGLDATIGGYTFTNGSGASSSIYANAPSYPSGSFVFTNGVSATINYTLFLKETVLQNTFTVNDGAGHTGTGAAGNIVVAGNSLNHYANISTDTPVDSDGVDTFQAVLVARDLYGNMVAGDAAIGLAVNQLDANNPGLLAGTIAGINMTSGTQTISNLTYNVFGSMELVTTGGSVSMAGARSLDYVMDIVIGTLNHYSLTLASPATAGTPEAISVLAEDYGNNTIPDATVDGILDARNYQWSQGLNDSPESDTTTPNINTNFSLDFTNGVAPTTINFVNAETLAIAGLDITDDAGTPIVGTSAGTLLINPNVADHIVFLGAAAGTADNTTNYTVTIESRDQFGNLNQTNNAADSNLTLSPIRVSGLTNVGPLGGTITGIDLQNNASVVRNDINYQVPHISKFGFTTGPSTSIDDARSTQVTWAAAQLSVASYTLEPDVTTITAGANLGATLTAYDGGSNIITNADGVLDTLTFTFTTSSDCDAPHANFLASGGDPANGAKTFTSGVTALTYNVYSTLVACGSVGDFSIVDNNTTGVSNTVAVTTINPAVSHHFDTTASGFSANADTTAQTGTSVTVELHDLYGNPRTDAISGTLLSFQKVSGYGASTGTLEACSPVAGDACGGGKQAITAINVDFSGSATQVINDFNYDVAHTIEVQATSGGITTPTGYAADLKLDSVTGTVGSYTFTRPAATGTAGTANNWAVVAIDRATNPMTGAENETMLEGMTYTVSDLSGGQMDGPHSGTVSFPAGVAIDFNNATGGGPIAVHAYHDVNNIQVNWLQFSDSATAVTVNNNASNTMDIANTVPNHFHTVTSGFTNTELSDGSTNAATSILITLHDTYGNKSTGLATTSVAPIYRSGFGSNIGVLEASTTDGGARVDVTGLVLDFSSVSDITLYDIGYNVFQNIDLRAIQGGVSTSGVDATDFDFDFSSSTVGSYVMVPDSGTGVAGTATNWTVTALDLAGNTMTGATNKAELDSRTITFSDNSAGNMNGPESGTVSFPAAATMTWSSGAGTTTFAMTAFNKANDIGTAYIKMDDDFGVPVSATNSAANVMTIAGASGEHFHVTGTGFASNASATQDLATSVTIELQDAYGNPTVDAAVTAATIGLNQVSGFAGLGTFSVSTTDGGGSPTDITTLTPNFSAVTSVTYYDVSYDVGHVMELDVTHGSVASGTATGDSQDLAFNVVAQTIQNYSLTFDNASHTAGVATPATLTALDGGGNTVTGNDATLNTLNYAFTVLNTNYDAPNASQTVALNDPTDGTLTFTAGVTSLNWNFYNTGTVPVGQVTVTDTTNSIARANQDTIVVDPSAATYFLFINPAESITGTPTTVEVRTMDTYANIDTNFQTDVDLVTSGSATGFGSIDIINGVGTLPINDAVAETVALTLNDVNTTGLTLDTEDVIFTGPPNEIVFLTEPVSNETINKNFATQPQVEVRDAAGTRVWADSATVVTLSPFLVGGCSSAAAGSLSGNSGTVTAGRFTFTTLQHSGVESIYIDASSGGLTKPCAALTTVYDTLSIDNAPGGNLETAEVYRFEMTGGVPPLTTASSTLTSGGSIGGSFTGGLCTAGKICFDYTPGATVGGNDTFDVRDSANVTNQDAATFQVDGALLSNTGDAVAFGSTALDITNTFTILNSGNINTGALSVVFTPTDASYWTKTPDFCDTNSLANAADCDVNITFLGATGNAGNPVNGAQTATLTITGANNGSITLNLTATRSGAIFNNIGASGAWGLTAADVQQTFTIRNDGTANSGTISSVFTPTDASYWNLDSNACHTDDIAAAATCTVQVTFLGATGNGGNPVNGAQTATLAVIGATGGVENISLTATRDGAILSNVGSAPAYGLLATDVQRTFTIRNTGNGTTGALGVVFTPTDASYWNVDSDACDTNTLATNGTQCDIQITFLGATGNGGSPANGAQTATLTVTGATAGIETLNLTATRDGAILTNIGAAPAYGTTGTDDPLTFTISNAGNGTTGALSVVFTPGDASYWSVDSDLCNTNTLATNGTQCDIQITFLGATGNGSSPVSGPQAATLTITGGTAGIETLNLTGTIP